MMVKLTEEMVLVRSRNSDLSLVKKLNCWGSDLSDVSVIRRLSNVEVLSLSVNQISSLADFQHCMHLQELYIRKNNIKNINDVLYLKDLPKLRSLWLADNPCAYMENYRLTVIRCLPHLHKLDNVIVTPEEIQSAMVNGFALPLGSSNTESPHSSTSETHSISSTKRDEVIQPSTPVYRHHRNKVQESSGISFTLQEDDRSYSSPYNSCANSHKSTSRGSSHAGTPFSGYDLSPLDSGNRGTPSDTNCSVKEQGFEDGRSQCGYRKSNIIQEGWETPLSPVEEHYNKACNQAEQMQRSASYASLESQSSKPYPIRPKTRNANILSAALCLIKELDYTGLEVIEMAVRCRMQELED